MYFLWTKVVLNMYYAGNRANLSWGSIIVWYPKISTQNRSKFLLAFKCTGCPTKGYTLFWGAVAPLNFELGMGVGGVLESSGSQLWNAYNSFSVAFGTPEIFEFKVDYPSKKFEICNRQISETGRTLHSSLL